MFKILLHASPLALIISAVLSALAFLPGMFVGLIVPFILYVAGIRSSFVETLGIICMIITGTLASGFTFCLCFGLFGCVTRHFKG